MLTIDLKLFVTLTKYLPDNQETIQVPSGTTAGELMKNLGIPENEVKLIFINGIRKKKDVILKDKDRVGMFPPVGGG